MQVGRGVGEPSHQALGPGERIARALGGDLDRRTELAGAQIRGDTEDARRALDADLRVEPSLLAEVVGQLGAARTGVRAAPGALDRQDLLPQFAAEPQAHLPDQPLPVLDDLQRAGVALAQGLLVDSPPYGDPRRAHVLEAVAAGVLVLEVVEQFLEQPGVRGVADPLVADEHLCLVHDLGPGQVPESHLVLAPPVDPDVDERTALQRDVVGEGDHRLVPAPCGDVHVRLDLVGLEGVPVGLGLHQRGPQLARPLDPDDPVRAARRFPVRQGDLGERLHPAGRGAEGGGEAAAELRHLRHHGQHDGGGPRLALPVALEGGAGEQPGGAPGVVVGEGLLGRTGQGDLLLRGTGAARGLRPVGGGGGRTGLGGLRTRRRPVDGVPVPALGGYARGRRRRRPTRNLHVRTGPLRSGPLRLGADLSRARPFRAGRPRRGRLPVGRLRHGRLRVVVDVDAVVGGQPREARGVPLADRAELPLPRTPVQLAEDQGADLLDVVDREPGEPVARAVGEGEPEVVELAEAGAPVAAGGDDHLVDLRRDGVQVKGDPVLAAVGGRGLAEQVHAAVARDGVVVEAEVGVAADLAVGVEQQHRDVGVPLTGGAAPPQADHHGPDVLAQRRQTDVGALDHLVHEAPQMHSRPERTPAAHRVTCVVRHTIAVRSEH